MLRMLCLHRLYIEAVTSGVLEGYVQGGWGLNHYPIYRHVCLSGIDACICRDVLKWNISSFHVRLKPSRCTPRVAMLKLCRWRPMRALLLYLWCKCVVPWFFWTFFHFSSLFVLLPWNFGTFWEVRTRDHCKVGLFYSDMLALNIVLLTAFLCWDVRHRTCAFVVHFDIFEFHNGFPCVQSYWCFLIIMGGHLVMSYMAL